MKTGDLEKALFIDRNYTKVQIFINEFKELLLQSNFKIDGSSFLKLAIDYKDKEAMSFLTANGYDLNLKDEFNETALSAALGYLAPVEIIEHLIDLGADYNISFGDYKLYQYVLLLDHEDKLDIFNIFIKKGINPYLKIDDIYPIFQWLTHAERNKLGLIASNKEIIEYELESNPGFTALNKLENKTHTAKEWLSSKTYINDKVNFEFNFNYLLSYFILPAYIKYINPKSEKITKDNLQNIIDSIPSVPTIDNILKVNALSVIDNSHYLLITPYSNRNTLGFTHPISKDGLSKIELTTSMLSNSLKLVYVHEEAHQTMFRVFQNSGNPYLENDQESIGAYDLAIKNTLVNIYQFWFAKQCETTNFTSNYDLGHFTLQEVTNNLISYSTSIKFLGTNLDINYLGSYLGDFAAFVAKEISYDLGAYIRSFESNNSNYLKEKYLIFDFLKVYDTGYEAEDEHVEFIVRCPEALAGGIPSNMLSVFAPIQEYYDNYVTPSIVGYINNHPNSHLIEG